MPKLKYLSSIFLLIILFLGFFFRFYHLGESPQGIYLDEASIGYNAYSILNTGKDEYGLAFPLLFRSVGDFKTPVYIYLLVPLVSLFGLSVQTVRLPSAIFGFLTIIVLYLLLKKLISSKHSQKIAHLSAFFLSISPWHIILSRTAYEATIALFLLLLGIYFFLFALKKTWLFSLSAFFFALSFTAYHAERIVAPVVLVSLLIYYRKDIFTNFSKKIPPYLLSLVVGLSIIGPTLFIMRSPGFLKRAATLNIFSYSNQMPYGFSNYRTAVLDTNFYNNKYLLSAKEFSSLYLSYFSPRYLFSLGDSSLRSSYPGVGTFFVWQFPLFLLGLYVLFKENKDTQLKNFLFTLLFVSPLPAALTRDPYSIIRALPMVIPLVIILSLGAVRLFEISRKISPKIILSFIIIILSLSLSKFFVSVFYYNDYFNYASWNYGWRQAIDKINTLDQKYSVVIDNSRSIPYPIVLFYLQYNPLEYQKTNFEVTSREYYNNLDQNPVKNIGRVTVRQIVWGKDTDDTIQYLVGDTLVISDREIHNHGLEKISDILNPDGSVALRIVKTKPITQR